VVDRQLQQLQNVHPGSKTLKGRVWTTIVTKFNILPIFCNSSPNCSWTLG